MALDFSVGWRLGAPGNTMHAAIAAQPDWAWIPAIDERRRAGRARRRASS